MPLRVFNQYLNGTKLMPARPLTGVTVRLPAMTEPDAQPSDSIPKQISLDQPHEVRLWCITLRCTSRELREAVRWVGNSPDKVRAFFKSRQGD